MNGCIDISNNGTYAVPVKRIDAFSVLAATNTAQAITTQSEIWYQKLWIYPGTDGHPKITANASDIYVGDLSLTPVSTSGTATFIASGNVVTVHSVAHGFNSGDYVTMGGSSPAIFNGKFPVTRVDADNFTYSILDLPLEGSVNTVVAATGTLTTFGFQTATVIVPDKLAATDLPLKYELPYGQRQRLSDIRIYGAQNDGVFWRAWQ